MHDGKALQAGTSHYFGDGFAKAFDITYADKDNKLVHPFQTSWGVTTRLIGAIIMTHGDDNGLILPPMIAPKQLVVIPIASHKAGVVEKAQEVLNRAKKVCRAIIDISEQSPGWKFAEYEMKGIPLRLELGPRDIENNCCVLVRRDNGEKSTVSLDNLEQEIADKLEAVQQAMFQKALARRERMTFEAHNLDEMINIANEKPGFIKAMWCGDSECEERLKEKTGVTSRCAPFEQEVISDVCVCCGKPAKKLLYWGKAY